MRFALECGQRALGTCPPRRRNQTHEPHCVAHPPRRAVWWSRAALRAPSNGRAARALAHRAVWCLGRYSVDKIFFSSIAPLYHITYNTCEYTLRAHPMCTMASEGLTGPRSPNRGPAPTAPNAPRRLNPANAHRPVPLYCSPVSIDHCAQLAASRPARPSQLRRASSEGRGGGQTGVRARDGVGRGRLECSGNARAGAPPREYSLCPLWAVGRLSGSRRAAWRPRSVTTTRRWSRDSPECRVRLGLACAVQTGLLGLGVGLTCAVHKARNSRDDLAPPLTLAVTLTLTLTPTPTPYLRGAEGEELPRRLGAAPVRWLPPRLGAAPRAPRLGTDRRLA